MYTYYGVHRGHSILYIASQSNQSSQTMLKEATHMWARTCPMCPMYRIDWWLRLLNATSDQHVITGRHVLGLTYALSQPVISSSAIALCAVSNCSLTHWLPTLLHHAWFFTPAGESARYVQRTKELRQGPARCRELGCVSVLLHPCRLWYNGLMPNADYAT